MSVDLTAKTDQELANLIENHRKKGLMDAPLYLAALQEKERRHPAIFDPAISRRVIFEAARNRQFLSYGQLAEAHGLSWSKARRPMPAHLWALISHAHDRGWPMLSAIVVNKPNVITGEMDGATLKGFITAAHDLGRSDIDADPEAFLRKEQERLFKFAQEHPNL